MTDQEAQIAQIMHEAAIAMERAHERINQLEMMLDQTRAALALTRERLRRMTEGEL